MNATHPAARPFLALQQFLACPLDATLPRRRLLRVLHPTDELVAAERRQALPQHQDFCIRSDRCLQIFSGLVNRAVRESLCHRTSELFCDRQARRLGLNGFAASRPNRAMSMIGSQLHLQISSGEGLRGLP